MNRGINPGAIGVRVGVLIDEMQAAALSGEFGRFFNAVRFLETLAAPYLRRPEVPRFQEALVRLKWPEAVPQNRDAAFEVGHERVAEVLCCLNHHGIYGFRQVPYGDTDDLGDDELGIPGEPDDDGAPAGGGVDEAAMEGPWIEVPA